MKLLDGDGVLTNKSELPAYWVWRGILLRCSSNHPTHYFKYKARGIDVCERWLTFEHFLSDMGHPPPGLSIDRINNDAGYGPTNCRWATKTTQARNRRYIRPITFDGRTQLLTDWAKEIGIKVTTLSMRMDSYGWTVERALSTPTMGK